MYFLKLGVTGFGGPVALTNYMEQDLVERNKWVTRDEFLEGLALAQLAPGPLATQLAIYLGWVRHGVLGATLVGISFVLPSFLICVALAILYIRLGNLQWIQNLFYTIGAAVIAIIVVSSYKLVKKTLTSDKLLGGIWAMSALYTILTESESAVLILLAGFIPKLFKYIKRPNTTVALIPVWLLMGINGEASTETLWNIAKFFTKAGALVFGSGLAIVPFLYSGVVQQHHWLTERQFLDAVAVAMITPGPIVITVSFIGYLVAGLSGAVIAAAGTFLPCYLFTVLPAPYFSKIAKNERIKGYINGVTAAAVGAIAGAGWVLGKRAIVDLPTASICLITFLLLVKYKIPEPWLIVLAGIVGLLI